MDTLEAIKTRRSTRKYLDKPVEKEKIEKVVEAGRYAPSGANNQSTHFIVINNKEVLKDLADIAREEFAKMEVTPDTYVSLKNAINASKNGSYIFHYNAPTLIITANKKNYGNNMADSVGAIENMLIAANELDLGSCWINQLHWLTENERILEYLKKLGLNDDELVCASMVIGYPDTKDRLPLRKVTERKGNEVTYID